MITHAKKVLTDPTVNDAAKRLVSDELLHLRSAANALESVSAYSMILKEDADYCTAIARSRAAMHAIKTYLKAVDRDT
jgi:hypothetical protein